MEKATEIFAVCGTRMAGCIAKQAAIYVTAPRGARE